MKDFDVLCAGLMVMDVVASGVDRTVFDRDTTYAGHILHATGGDALNVAINLANLGARVCMSGAVGDDFASGGVLGRLKKYGVFADYVQKMEGEVTATSIVLCTPGGDRHFVYQAGANDRYDASALTDAALARAGILFVGSFLGLPMLDGEPLIQLMCRARSQGLQTAMDACGGSRAADKPALLLKILPYLDVFFPSEEEAAFLGGGREPRDAARYFVEKGARLAGVKLGGRGCFLTDGNWGEAVPALPCEDPLDTTGAGDAFMAGFLRGMTLGLPPSRCARMGVAMGSRCIQSLGATTHESRLESILQLADRVP